MARITRRRMMAGTSAAGLLGLSGPAGAAPAPNNAPPSGQPQDSNWLHYANDLTSARYAPFDQINAGNFNRLEMVWRFSTNALGAGLDADFQATPLFVKGRIFTTAGDRRDVVCLDGATGELLWLHRYDEGARYGSRGGPGLGVGYWSDGARERIIYVTRGYNLFSLDAATGRPDPAFGDQGRVDLRLNDDQDMHPSRSVIGLHAPPLVVRDTIVVGAAPTVNSRGYIRGFDIRTGRRKWIFHTIPHKGEYGYDTWLTPGQAETIGNGGCWASMSADEDLGLVYCGVESAASDLEGAGRHGPGLFGESLVALDIETGTRKWHYQMIHHGLWDRDVSCAGILCDLVVDGRTVKAIAQPSKQGYVYVLDRATGKPVWPIPEVPVPRGDVPGEWYAPTQPMPTKPPPFTSQGVGESDLVDFTPQIKARALEIAAHYKLGPLFTPPPLLSDKVFGCFTLPGLQGGANWPGGSYDPHTGMLYIFAKKQIGITGVAFNADGKLVSRVTRPAAGSADADGGAYGGFASITGGNHGVRFSSAPDGLNDPIIQGMVSIEGIPLEKPPYGAVTAIDLNKGTIVWQVVHGQTPDHIRNHRLLKGVNVPRTGQSGILGTLTTASLVILGDCGLFTDETGRKGCRLRAYDKATGEEKGAVFMDKTQTGAAMTYMHKGRQYIVTAIGSSHGADLVAFALPDSVLKR